VRTGSVLRRDRISCRWLGRVGSRCCAITMGAGKSLGRVATSVESASIPPADEPTTTRCENGELVAIASVLTLYRLRDSRLGTPAAREDTGRNARALPTSIIMRNSGATMLNRNTRNQLGWTVRRASMRVSHCDHASLQLCHGMQHAALDL